MNIVAAGLFSESCPLELFLLLLFAFLLNFLPLLPLSYIFLALFTLTHPHLITIIINLIDCW